MYAITSLVITNAHGIANQIIPSNISENDCSEGTTIKTAMSIQLIWLNCYLSPFSRLSCDTNSMMAPNIINYETKF